jgi:hypothetical protein
MSTILNKILLIVGAIITAGALGLIIYNQFEHKAQLTAIQTQVVQQQQLIDGIVRSQSSYASSADLAKFAADNDINLKAIQANLTTLNSSLAAINVITVTSTGQTTTNQSSTGTGPANPKPPTTTVACTNGTCPNPDPNGFMKAEQQLALNEDFGTLKVPFGTVGFSAWQAAPWNTTILPRTYNVDTVVGTDANERQTFYNKFTVDVGGHTYDIPIAKATTEQQVPTATWSWWNPRILMGLDGGINISRVKGEFTPSVNLGIMSYGQYKTTPDFSILEVGLGYGTVNKTGELVITPVSYNIGKKLFSPLMNNTYIGPSLQIGTDGSFGVGAGLRVGF